MATTYVVLNNDYAVDDYAQANYVGTASDLYVELGYIQDAVLGIATLDCVGTLNASANIIEGASAEISAIFSTTADINTVFTSLIPISVQTTLSSSINTVLRGTTTIDCVTTTQIQGNAIASGDVSMDGVLDVTIQINAIVSPSADISAQFEFNATADKIQQLSAELITAGDEVTWDTALTWYEPRSDVWAKRFDISEVLLTRLGQASLPSSFTVSAQGVITAIADITANGFATVDAVGNANFTSPATLASASTVSTAAFSTTVVEQQLNAEFNLSSSAIQVTIGLVDTVSASFTTTMNAIITAVGSSTQNSTASVDLTGNDFRIRFGDSNINSEFTQTATARRFRGITEELSAQAQLQSSANPRYGAFEDELNAEFIVDVNGGRLRLLSATIDAFTSTLGVLTLYNIDPYRVYPVQSEQRFTKIVPDSRVFMLLDENRVNTIVGEPRHFTIPSETRQITVQPNPLVELDTTLDRRQG